jgi:hypothetical protein
MLRRTLWATVTLVVLAASARAGTATHGNEPHWNGWDLQDKFQEIDRKLAGVGELRALQARDRATLRRILAIEASLRDIEISHKQLVSHLDKLDTAIDALRKDLAAARESAPPTPAEPGTAPPHVGRPTAAEPAGPVADIVDEQEVRNGPFVTITGRVRNLSDKPLTFVRVQITFVDDRGNVVKTETAYTEPRVIAPNTRGSFRINTRTDPRIVRHRLSVQAR